MERTEKLSTEEKLRIVREQKGIPQSAIADALDVVSTTISRIENKQEKSNYTDSQIKIVRKLLSVESAPILNGEDVIFKKRLYVWLDAIKSKRFDEAEDLQHELSAINSLPFEIDLALLYRLIEIRFLLTKNDVKLAEEKVKLAQPLLQAATNEALYHFNYNMGMLCMREMNCEEALTHFKLADNLKPEDFEKETTLYFNIAACYCDLGMYIRSIGTLTQAYHLYKDNSANLYSIGLENMLATCYMRIGDVDQARELLDKCLITAKSLNHKTYIGAILHNHGCASFKAKNYPEALAYFEDAFEYLIEGEWFYIENLYHKARCLIVLKNPLSKEVIHQAKSAISASENYELLFSSLAHLLTLKEEPSHQYIEQTTIPYLLSKFKYSLALDYCEVLDEFFTKKRNTKKALEIKAIAYGIKDKIMKGGSA